MSVSFSFGSFGDIISLIQIGHDTIKVLRNVKDASTGYQEFYDELQSTVNAVLGVEHLLSTEADTVAPSVKNGLDFAVKSSLKLMERMKIKISTFLPKSKGDISRSSAMLFYTWKRIDWELFHKGEWLDLRRRLKDQIGVMNVLSLSSHSYKITPLLKEKPPPLYTPPLIVISSSTNPSDPSLMVSDKEIGRGSNGTIMFEGSLQGRPVAVKRIMKRLTTLAHKEVQLLREADHHPNVVRYYYLEVTSDFLYVVLDLCPATLADLIDRPAAHAPLVAAFDAKRALREILAGLRHLHALHIVYRDVKPQNILVAGARPGADDGAGRMLLSDFGICKQLAAEQTSFIPATSGAIGDIGWRAPEVLKGQTRLDELARETGGEGGGAVAVAGAGADGVASTATATPLRLRRSVDVFAFGCLMFYVLTKGGHPFGPLYERDGNVLRGNHTLDGLDKLPEGPWEARNIIDAMVEFDASKRPTIEKILLHPYFWEPSKRMAFLQDASGRFEDMGLVELAILEKNAAAVGDDWLSRLQPAFMEVMQKRGETYKARSVRDLLRILRKEIERYPYLLENARHQSVSLPPVHPFDFPRLFPRLVLHVYDAAANSALRRPAAFSVFRSIAISAA